MDIIKVILTSLLSVAALFIAAKIMGHKQVSQLDFFDYINGITIGSVAAELATELEQPWKPLIAIVIYSAVAFALSILTGKKPTLRKYINGTPTILMNKGKLYRDNFKKAKLDLSEFMMLCRQQGYFELNDIQTAVFEYNGQLTILPYSLKRPLNPADISLIPQDSCISTEVIADGRILEENLRRKGLDLNWLQSRLREQGCKNAEEVFLAVCDDSNSLTIFKTE